MRILTRYVLSELIKLFLVSLSALTILMIIGGVVREAAAQNLPLREIVLLIPYILPDALRVAVPVTLLLAATGVYGRLAGTNEVVAIKAQGISPMAILWPVFILSTVLSIATIWLNDLAVSWGRQGAQKVVVEAVADIAYSMLKADGSYSSPSFSINVREVEGQRLISPTISVPTRGSQPATTITADWAELESDKVAGVLRIALWNSTFDIEGEVTMRYPGLYVQEVSLRDASRAKCDSMHPSTMSLRDMPEQKVVQRKLIEQTDYKLAARAAYQMLAGDFQALTEKKWHGQLHNREATWGRLHRLRTEPHRRCSAGFACLCFVWVGAPMAIRRRTSDFLTSFFLCFLPILAVYYPLLAYGIDGAKGGTLPPYAVWAGNILLLAWGTYLLKRVIRY